MLKSMKRALGKATRVVITPKPGHKTPKSLKGRYGSVVSRGGLRHRGVRSVLPDGWSKPRLFDVDELRPTRRP